MTQKTTDVNLPPSGGPAISVVISYARVSSGKQRRTGEGLQRQIDMANEWASERGLTLDDRRFTDAGLSASKGDHLEDGAALQRILQAASSGALGTSPVLLIEDASRLSRLEPLESLERVFLPLVRSGVRIVLLEDGTQLDADTLNRDQGALLMLVLKIQAAAAYAQKLRHYGLKHRARNRQQILDGQPACPGWAPSWISFVDGRFELNDYSPSIARLIELLWENGSQVTANTLNLEGHKSPTGRKWTQAALLRLLENQAIYGARRVGDPDHASKVKAWRDARQKWAAAGSKGDPPYKPKRTYQLVEGAYPPLLSKEDYERLLAVIARRTTSPKEKGRRDQVRYVGQGLTYCACGERIGIRHVKSKKGSKLTFSYLFCRGKELGTTGCVASPSRLEPIQVHLLTRIQGQHLASLVEGDAAAKDSKSQALLAEQATLQAAQSAQQQQVANARQTLKERAKSGRSVEVYEEALEESQASLAETTAKLAAIQSGLHALQGEGLATALDEAVALLLQQFSREEDTPDQRRAVNQLLAQLGVRVIVDLNDRLVGLQVGDGPVDWRPYDEQARSHALQEGMANPQILSSRPGELHIVAEGTEPTPEGEDDWSRLFRERRAKGE